MYAFLNKNGHRNEWQTGKTEGKQIARHAFRLWSAAGYPSGKYMQFKLQVEAALIAVGGNGAPAASGPPKPTSPSPRPRTSASDHVARRTKSLLQPTFSADA